VIERSVFPLHSVMFPKMQLPLRIFETRYVDMVADCLKAGDDFVIACIQDGDEVGGGATVQKLGVQCRIVNFEQEPGNILNVLVEGRDKVEIHNTWYDSGGLMKGLVAVVDEAEDCEVDVKFAGLINMVQQFMDHPESPLQDLNFEIKSAQQVSYLLAEFLPITLASKQSLLEIHHPYERLEAVSKIVGRLEFTLTA